MAHMIVTADVFDWNVPGKNGRVVRSFKKGGPYTVPRECLEDAVAIGAGHEHKTKVTKEPGA